MDEKLRELIENYSENALRFEKERIDLQDRFLALGERRKPLLERWRGTPHSEELKAKCEEVMKPVMAVVNEWLKLDVERKDRVVRFSKVLTKSKVWKTKKSLPAIEDMVRWSRWDLDEGLPRREALLEEYEPAIGLVELFFEREVPPL